MKDITHYKNQLIEEVHNLSFNVNPDEIIEIFEEAIQDLNLGSNNFVMLNSKLGSPKEFVNNYITERFAQIEKPVHIESQLISQLQSKGQKSYNTPFTYIHKKSTPRLLVLLFPAFIIAFTLMFGNNIDYNESNSVYYGSLYLIWVFVLYELFVLLTRIHFTSYYQAILLRNVYRGIFLFGLLIYLVNPFDYKGSLTEYLDEFPDKEGSVAIGGTFDYILGYWFITFILFEITIYLQELISKSNSSTHYIRGISIKIWMYEVAIIVALIIPIILNNQLSIPIWLVIFGFMGILYLQFSNKIIDLRGEKSNLIPFVFYGLLLSTSIISNFENDFIDQFGLRFLLVLAIIGLPNFNESKIDKRIVPSKFQSVGDLLETYQLKITNNLVFGKIKIFYVFLFFLITELYNKQAGPIVGRNTNPIVITLSLIVFVFVIIELYHPINGQISIVMATLERNKFLLLYLITSSWVIINNFANFYEGINLHRDRYGNSDYRWIDYQLEYIHLILYGIFFGIILIFFQNSILHDSRINALRSLVVVFVVVIIELMFALTYLLYFAFSGIDARHFKANEFEIFTGLFLFLALQLLIPLINLIRLSSQEPGTIIPNPT